MNLITPQKKPFIQPKIYNKTNYALSFDGVDDNVIFQNAPTTNIDNITMEATIKPVVDDTYNRIAYIGDSGKDGWGLYINPSNRITVLCGGVGTANSNYIVTSNEILTCRIARDNGTWRIWVNGNERTVNSNPTIREPITDEFTFADNDFYEGDIINLKVWNIVNTTYSVDKILNGTETGLVAYYKMNEGSGTTLTDSAGNNDGKIIGATWQEVDY